jgi:hypothetical protein
MAIYTRGLIVFEDVMGKTAKMTLRGVTDLQKVKDFATQMSSRTRAKIIECSYHESEGVDIGSAVAGKWDSVDNKAEIYLEDTDTGLGGRWQLPAPLETLFDHVSGVGYVMKQVQGDSIKDDYNTATGKIYRFNKGRFKGINTQAQV